MTKAEVKALIGYHPDPAAVRRRLVREAEELLRWGQTNKRHQPVLASLAGQLRKFYLYPAAILIHFAVDAAAALLSGLDVNMILIEIVVAVLTAAAALFARRLWRETM